jgi:drug/metabolite transporter (DMT)-like permease
VSRPAVVAAAPKTAAIAPPDNVRRAILYMVYSAALIPLLNASAKYLTANYSVVEIAWARYAGHFFYMLIVFAPRRGPRLLVSSRPVLQLVRSSLLFLSTAIYVSALGYIPLATAAAIGFMSPFIVTALAPFVLGEKVGLRRWVSVALGFAGAMVVIRPGAGAVSAAALLVLGSATSSALYQLMTRKLAAHDPAETSITYIAMAGFLLASVALPFTWKTPETALDLLLFVGLGIFGGFGHYFMVRAYELAPAPLIAPFNYAQLIGSVILGVAVFGQFPDLWTWVGSAIIVGTGIYLLLREGRRRKPA